MKLMTQVSTWLAAALLCFSSWAMATTASDVVRSTADQVIARINQDRDRLKTEPTALYGLVEQLVAPNFNFRRMSSWVLGKNWRVATDVEKDAFTEQFRILMVRTYAKALLEYTDQPINYLGEFAEPDGETITVKTELLQKEAKPVDISYRMSKDGDAWKVVDVLVGGISLVATYRGEFSSKVSEAGVAGLISTLTERNAQRAQ